MAKKTLDDLFRDSSRFDELGGPSPDVWRRLETRLETKLEDRKKAAHRRRIRFLQLGAVGLTIFLLGMAAAFVLHFERKKAENGLKRPIPVLIDSLRRDSLRLIQH